MSVGGDIVCIRDWFNASIYNKDEIDSFFIQNNSSLYAYDLTLSSFDENIYVRLEGQTSHKVYSVITNEITGSYHGIFWFAQNETVKVIDGETETVLVTHVLSNRKDTITYNNS